MLLIDAMLFLAMMFFLFLPITDRRTVQMRLLVVCGWPPSSPPRGRRRMRLTSSSPRSSRRADGLGDRIEGLKLGTFA